MPRLALLLVLLGSPKSTPPQVVPDAGAADPFPPGTFADDGSWFADALRAMGEARIDQAPGTTIRFTSGVGPMPRGPRRSPPVQDSPGQSAARVPTCRWCSSR